MRVRQGGRPRIYEMLLSADEIELYWNRGALRPRLNVTKIVKVTVNNKSAIPSIWIRFNAATKPKHH